MTRISRLLPILSLALAVIALQAFFSEHPESSFGQSVFIQNSFETTETVTPNLFDSIAPGESISIFLDMPDDALPLEMVMLPAGRFSMGSPGDESGRRDNESPQHLVTISQPFFMGRYEVTQAQYEAVMGVNPARNYGFGSNFPVYSVSWFDAARFCNRLSRLAELQPVYDEVSWTVNEYADGFRLPTEAQWEYACRAGTETRFYWGDDHGYDLIENYAWYEGNAGSQAHEVGQKLPNAWGLYDMSGNVWEWCQDWLSAYREDHQIDPAGPIAGSTRMTRGGSWGNLAVDLRSALRSRSAPANGVNNIGFRVVLVIPDPAPPPTPTPTPEPPREASLLERSDLNQDGFIDSDDLVRFIAGWNTTAETSDLGSAGDLNQDGAIDSKDLFLFMTGWHKNIESSQIMKPGETISIPFHLPDGATPLEMISVPAGEFVMGSPADEPGRRDNEGPQHRVTITEPFYLGKFQITQAQYEAVMGENPAHTHGVGPNHAVFFVTWFDAALFCNRLSDLTGRERVYNEQNWTANRNANGFRLPTEAEWEYACRAGARTRYFWGEDSIGDYAWYIDNSSFRVQEVGLKRPNPLGLYDMNGNVWEWCHDWLGSYQEGHRFDPVGPTSGVSRVFRGGSWGSSAGFLRSALRSGFSPSHSGNDLGFRVALPQRPE